jgi:hypothetical protein
LRQGVVIDQLPDGSQGAMALAVHVNWDLTYGCQLRCVHCYSQAGRRPSRALPLDLQRQVAQRLIDARVVSVAFAGGEPMLDPGLWSLAEQLLAGGVRTALYTNGLLLNSELAARASHLFSRVHVSLDGPDAAVHDRIRGRSGAFAGALAAVKLLLDVRADVGLDVTLLRSTFSLAARFVTEVAPQVPGMAFLHLGGVVPAGLASRPAFATELLSTEQLESLDDGSLHSMLAQLAPPDLALRCFSNRDLSHAPCWPAHSTTVIQVEPDGDVRAMALYEGTVGSLIHQPLEVLLARIDTHRKAPQVRHLLSQVQDAPSWASTTRRLDWAHASTAVRRLIERRGARVWLTPAP